MEKLKEYRIKNKMTQKEVADVLSLTQQAYASYENSDRIPNHSILEKLSNLYKVSITELLSNTDSNDEMEDLSIEEYLNKSYTAYHAIKNSERILLNNGFTRLYDFNKWNLKEGSKHYVIKNGSAIIAFKVGDLSNYSFKIAEAHSDSPSLKIKGDSLLDSPEGKRINIEKYGGGIMYSFMDIPLKIAGRIFIKNEGKIIPKLVTSDFNVNIPSLCIHHNPTVNDGMAFNVQNDMLPLLGKDIDSVFNIFRKGEEVIDGDLYVVPAVKAYYSGINKEFLVSSRIDNLTSAYSVIDGIVNADSKGISIACIFDNEEVGSSTKQGAASSFLENTLRRINDALGYTETEYNLAISNGFTLSIDNGHAVHQAHPEKSDVDQKVYMNKGVVIKHHVNYSTDGLSSSIVKAICDKNNIEHQDYYNRSDLRCGSTIGLITSTHLEMNTCDIGLAQLAMHSAIETVGRYDIKKMMDLVKAFFETKLEVNKEDEYIYE